MANLIDSVIVLRILKKLTTPWEKTTAFKTGLIDKNGKILVKNAERTPEQKKSLTTLDKLVFNLKRMLQKVPGGGSTLGSYVAALALLKEYVDRESSPETSKVLIEKLEEHNLIPPSRQYDLTTVEGFMDAWEDEMIREMSSGAAFGGAASGAGDNATINATGFAGVDKPLQKKKKNRVEKILSKRL